MQTLDWGLVDYAEALERQLKLVEQVQADGEETIVFCRHPAVVTLGRATEANDVFGWNGPVYEIQRGGRATYHGPSQTVVYPIIDLSKRGKDIHAYLRSLEKILINSLAEFNLLASQIKDSTGVWVGERKIASIGVGIKRWVTYHGIALNVTHDPLAFQGINPCGLSSDVMTSLEKETGHQIEFERVNSILKAHAAHEFGLALSTDCARDYRDLSSAPSKTN